MSDIAISVENLSKQYHIGSLKSKDDTLITTTLHSMAAPVRRTVKLLRGQYTGAAELDDVFWALQDISFQVKEKEVVGVIGRNGAGKSTLLKLLSRITYPTTGRIKIYGRVGSLLEVGTGFHSELTGRENVHLNGAVLGMSRAEIDRKFDEIVAFSGVERFIDTPVKHYSSGMSVRLAFAVAAHLEPEILLVDEVLSVGDMQFQNKCLGKMHDIASTGRTVVVVSHNMTSIRNLCQRTIWIEQGHIVRDGETAQVVEAYLAQFLGDQNGTGEVDLRDWPERYGDGRARILSACLLNDQGEVTTEFVAGQPLTVEYTLESSIDDPLNLTAVIASATTSTNIVHLSHWDTPDVVAQDLTGLHKIRMTIPSLPLNQGAFELSIAVHTAHFIPIDVIRHALYFSVSGNPINRRPFDTLAERGGFVTVPSTWEIGD
jgi:lipopolysaccharide transport system ATP-binding protein